MNDTETTEPERDTISGKTRAELHEEAEPDNHLPTLHNGHAWLLKFIFEAFRTEPFTFDTETCRFEGSGKGVAVQDEQDRTREWFSEVISHGAVVCVNLEDAEVNGTEPLWELRAMPSMADGGITLDPSTTLRNLLDEFVTVLSEEQIKTAACIVIKGDEGLPPTAGAQLQQALVAHGARKDILVLTMPTGFDLSLVPEDKMKAKGWIRKPKLWTPGQT